MVDLLLFLSVDFNVYEYAPLRVGGRARYNHARPPKLLMVYVLKLLH